MYVQSESYSSMFTCIYYAHCTVVSTRGNEGKTWEGTSFAGGKQQTALLNVYSCLLTHFVYVCHIILNW